MQWKLWPFNTLENQAYGISRQAPKMRVLKYLVTLLHTEDLILHSAESYVT